MKIRLLFALVILLAAGCNTQATPTSSDSEMATRVAQILTAQPTASATAQKTAAAPLPTVKPTDGPGTIAPPAVTATKAAVVAGSATPLPPTVAPTAIVVGTPTNTAVPTATPLPTATYIPGDPRARLGNPSWTDKMDDANNWPTGVDAAGFTEISFKDGNLLLKSLKTMDGWRVSYKKIRDVYIEMTVNSGTCTGTDRYGIIFRVPVKEDANQGYLLGFTCEGKYSLRKWDAKAAINGMMIGLTSWKASTAINAGANKINRLGVMVIGGRITLYANGQQLAIVDDLSYREGYFGIFAGGVQTSGYTIKVDEFSLWENPKP